MWSIINIVNEASGRDQTDALAGDPEIGRNPFRPPDWRWRLAGLYARNGARPKPCKDAWVRQAYDLHQAINADDPSRDTLGGVPRSTAQAVGIYRPETVVPYVRVPPLRRWVVEAYLLAHLAIHPAAVACNVPDWTVSAYEKLFFDVIDRKRDRDALFSAAILPLLSRPAPLDVIELTLKLVAVDGGPGELAALFNHLTTSLPAGDPVGRRTRPFGLEDWERRLSVTTRLDLFGCWSHRSDKLPALVRQMGQRIGGLRAWVDVVWTELVRLQHADGQTHELRVGETSPAVDPTEESLATRPTRA